MRSAIGRGSGPAAVGGTVWGTPGPVGRSIAASAVERGIRHRLGRHLVCQRLAPMLSSASRCRRASAERVRCAASNSDSPGGVVPAA